MTLQQLKKTVVDLLVQSPGLAGVTVSTAFAGTTGSIPSKAPLLALSVHSLVLAPSGMGAGAGLYSTDPAPALLATITLQFDCYLPQNTALTTWDTVLEALCEILLGAGLGATKIWCPELTQQKQILATHARARASLSLPLTLGTPGALLPLTAFQISHTLP